MTIIGTILLPLFLWLISSFLTNTSKNWRIPSGLSDGQMFSSVDSDPIEKC